MQYKYPDMLPCMVLCAGTSARFGGGDTDKMFADLSGKSILAHLLNRLQGPMQVGSIALNAQPAQGATQGYEEFELDLHPDCLSGGLGPLVGVLTAMRWAAQLGHDYVLTCPGDTPFLPNDWVNRLGESPSAEIVVSYSNGRAHYLCALWPAALAGQLQVDIENGARSVGRWISGCENRQVVFEVINGFDPFFNINTREDLEVAEKMVLENN